MLLVDPAHPGPCRIKVLDFGIAKLSHSSDGKSNTETGALIGTPAYMAPEQCTGNVTVDGKADVYALGVILYQMLSGRLPFEAEHTFDLMAAHVREQPKSLVELIPDIPPDIAALTHQMISKDPQARPTMEAIALRVERLLSSNVGAWSSSASMQTEIALGNTVAAGSSSFPRSSLESMALGATIPGPLTPAPKARPSREVSTISATAEPLPAQTSQSGSGSATAPVPRSQRSRLIWGSLALVGAALLVSGVSLGILRREPKSISVRSVAVMQEPRIVKWDVRSKPPGAEVVRKDGQVLGSTPWHTERPTDLGETTVTLRLAGYAEKVLLLSHNADLTTELLLDPLPPQPTAQAEEGEDRSNVGKSPKDSKARRSKSAATDRTRKSKPGVSGAQAPENDVKLLLD